MESWARATVALSLALLAGAAPAARADGGGAPAPPPADGGAPPPDNRFFPKEMEDALAAIEAAKDDEARFDALQVLQRLRHREGAPEALRARAFDPVLERALVLRHEPFVALAGEFLVALDRDRLLKAIEADGGKGAAAELPRLWLARRAGAPGGDALLAERFARSSNAEIRWRAVDALGALRSPLGVAPALALLREDDPERRAAAAMALGRIGDPQAAAPLLAGLAEGKGYHALFCAEALGRIEDPSILEAVLRSPGHPSARGKAVEVAARRVHWNVLVGLVQKSKQEEIRAGACLALGRLAREADQGGGAASSAAAAPLDAAERAAAADALLEAMVADDKEPVRAAAYWGLRDCRTDETGAKALKRLGVQGTDKLIYLVEILGLTRHGPAAPVLLKAIFSEKRPTLRRAVGLAFWRIGDRESIDKFKERLLAASDAEAIARGCEALGSWKSVEAFDLAMKLLRVQRDASPGQFQVELALEKMTGHFFGPSPGLWNKWREKNPNFFSPKQAGIDRQKWRDEFDKENRGFRQTPETENAVQRGLQWMARHQSPSGAFDCVSFKEQCEPGSGCDNRAGARTQIAPSGTSGLCTLAFLGAGYTPHGGKYDDALRRALDSLLSNMGALGDYDQPDLLFNRSYARPVALQALAEGYALTGDPRYRAGAERLLVRQFMLLNDRGGWRYAISREGGADLDSSVTAWVLFAVKTADKAGIPIPALFYEGCYLAFDQLSERVPQNGPREEWVDIDGDYGFEVGKDAKYLFQTGYQDPSGAASRATTPLGLMSRIFLGWRRSHPFCIGSANYINKYYLPDFDPFGEPGKEDWSKVGRFTPKGQWVMYSYYYCTVALHQMGGRFFRNWNRRIGRILPEFQLKEGCDRGAWEGWNTDRVYGRVYATGMAVLTLETYYRYAPILQD